MCLKLYTCGMERIEMTDPIRLNDELQHEASDLLREIGLDDILCKYGRIDYGGSYVYGTMVDRDIDIAVVVASQSAINAGQRSLLLQDLEKLPYCTEVKVTDRKGTPKEGRPLGIWFNPRLDYLGNRWNIDIWLVTEDEPISHHNMELHKQMLQITELQRIKILQLKYDALLNGTKEKGQTSVEIYNSVLSE